MNKDRSTVVPLYLLVTEGLQSCSFLSITCPMDSKPILLMYGRLFFEGPIIHPSIFLIACYATENSRYIYIKEYILS